MSHNIHPPIIRIDNAGQVGVGIDPATRFDLYTLTAATNTVLNVIRAVVESSGTAADGLGVGVNLTAEDAGGILRQIGNVRALWTDATNGTARLAFLVANLTTATERAQLTGSGDFAVGLTTTPQARVHFRCPTLGARVSRLETTATADDVIHDVIQGRVATTSATVATLLTLTLADDTAYLIEARVLARRTAGAAGAAGDCAAYLRRALAHRTAGGGAVLVGTVEAPFEREDQTAWDCTIDASGNDLRVRVTGAASNTVTWHCTAIVASVSL